MHALNNVELIPGEKANPTPQCHQQKYYPKTVAKIISQNLSQQNAANKRGQEGENIEKRIPVSKAGTPKEKRIQNTLMPLTEDPTNNGNFAETSC